ncbi:MAG: hypothetical protein FWE35_00945 [Streptosporangiales bacterium]|nr:hypothetical protein [Streptosporangiales bacterium]
MTTPDDEQHVAGEALEGYVSRLEKSAALGHLVVYSIFDGRVTPDELELWFIELGLDRAHLPGSLRPVDAYEKTTGELQVTYPVDAPMAGRGRPREPGETVATLMVRPVAADGEQITRHLVREVRDEGARTLDYETRLAEIVFVRDQAADRVAGGGVMRVTPDTASIGRLDDAERARVEQVIGQIDDRYQHRCTYLSGDRLRGIIRKHVEDLKAVRVRPTGGVYFVGDRHAATLQALRTLVKRFGEGSSFTRIPLPDEEEMREMVVGAWRERAKEELQRLSRDIAAARENGKGPKAVEALVKRFRALKATAEEHSGLLSETLEETAGAMELAEMQLRDLLTRGG